MINKNTLDQWFDDGQKKTKSKIMSTVNYIGTLGTSSQRRRDLIREANRLTEHND